MNQHFELCLTLKQSLSFKYIHTHTKKKSNRCIEVICGGLCGCGNICKRESRSRKIKHMCIGGPCRRGKEGLSAPSSDREGNKAVVLLNVSLQDVRAGTQDSLEPRPVQFDTL